MRWRGVSDEDGFDRLEKRLRRATAALVCRHIGKIEALARALMHRDCIEADDEIREIAGLAPPPSDGPIWLAFQAAEQADDEPIRIYRR